MTDRTATLASVCAALTAGDHAVASQTLAEQYPFAPDPVTLRRYGPVESTRVFIRDGFIDRYAGTRLVYPPVLRLISIVIPDSFPFHPNWKTDVTHPAFWEMGATVDHLRPVTLGGADDDSNWVTTSMARNSAKMNWSIDALGWTLYPPGDFAEWDGLIGWFLDYARNHPTAVSNPNLKSWLRAATLALSTG